MKSSQVKLLGNAVGFTIAANKEAVIKLLVKHGVNVNSATPTDQLITATIDKVTSDPAFNKDFDKLVKTMARISMIAAKKDAKSSADGGFDWGGLTGSLLSSGTSIFGTIKTTEAQKKLAEQQAKIAASEAQSAIALGQTQLEIERLRLQQAQLQQPSSSNKTLIYVGAGLIGVLLIGGLIFAIKK
jgi:ABC-type phosphate transport system auxiliary subunit